METFSEISISIYFSFMLAENITYLVAIATVGLHLNRRNGLFAGEIPSFEWVLFDFCVFSSVMEFLHVINPSTCLIALV